MPSGTGWCAGANANAQAGAASTRTSMRTLVNANSTPLVRRSRTNAPRSSRISTDTIASASPSATRNVLATSTSRSITASAGVGAYVARDALRTTLGIKSGASV